MHNFLFEVKDSVVQYRDNLVIFSSAADHSSLVEKDFKILRESKMKITKSKTLFTASEDVGYDLFPQNSKYFFLIKQKFNG